MVVFSRAHYQTFVFSSELHKWLLMNNAEEPKVFDSWAAVTQECGSTGLQPCMLFYRQLDSDSAAAAPGEVQSCHPQQQQQQQQQQEAHMSAGGGLGGSEQSGSAGVVVVVQGGGRKGGRQCKAAKKAAEQAAKEAGAC
jgi:hypothetical protein